MPPVTRWFIKSALVCLILAFLVGVVSGMQRLWGDASGIAALNPVFVHLLSVGWLSQLIFGIAFWMFPKSKDSSRGSEALAITCCITLNLGLALRAVAEPYQFFHQASPAGYLLLVSGVLQTIAVVCFVAVIWPRVRGVR